LAIRKSAPLQRKAPARTHPGRRETDTKPNRLAACRSARRNPPVPGIAVSCASPLSYWPLPWRAERSCGPRASCQRSTSFAD